MIKIMEDSAIEELRKQQEKRASEREKKQQEREAIKKQKEKERVNKLLKAQNNDMPAMFKFNVHHGETAMQSSEIGPVI
jgi:cell shape-determining protein MreC